MHRDQQAPDLGWISRLAAESGRSPANRLGVASLRLKHLVQGERQSARDLVTYVEGLQQDIPALSTEELRAWTMLNYPRGDIRKEVLRENHTISSRELVILPRRSVKKSYLKVRCLRVTQV
jgi:hypothetical protein